MNVGELRDWVRSQADIEDDEDFTDPKLNTLIQLGYDAINAYQDWPYLETQTDLTVASGRVQLPSDFSHLHDPVKYIQNSAIIRDLERIPWEEIPPNYATTGNPVRCWQLDGYVYLWPQPDDGTQARIRYFKAPTALTQDAHSPIFDSRFHVLCGQWALVKVWERMDVLDQAQIAKQEYLEGLERMDAFYLRLRRPSTFGPSPRKKWWDQFFANDPLPFEYQ